MAAVPAPHTMGSGKHSVFGSMACLTQSHVTKAKQPAAAAVGNHKACPSTENACRVSCHMLWSAHAFEVISKWEQKPVSKAPARVSSISFSASQSQPKLQRCNGRRYATHRVFIVQSPAATHCHHPLFVQACCMLVQKFDVSSGVAGMGREGGREAGGAGSGTGWGWVG